MFTQEQLEEALPIVHRYAAARINSDLREDLVQDALLKAWKCRNQWRGEGKLSTWLIRILINQHHGSFRRLRVHEPLTENIPDTQLSPFTMASENERASKIMIVVAGLPKPMRQCIRKFYIDGEREINLPTQKTRRFRALRILRKRLANVA